MRRPRNGRGFWTEDRICSSRSGGIPMPDWFWRRRLPEDFFELDIPRKSSSPPSRMNSQILRLDVMRPTFNRTWYPHSGLANRQRIHKNIVAIKNGLGIAQRKGLAERIAKGGEV